MSWLGYWTRERPSSCWTSLTSRAGCRTTGRKYRVPCPCIWPRTFPADPHRRPAGGLCPMSATCKQKARAWGIRGDSIVVVYDNSGGAQACRAWWTLRWAGLANVRVLDGGYGAWIATGRPSSNHVATHAALAGDVVLTSGGMPTIDAEEAAALATQRRLLDARPRAAYAGDPAKPGTGHIPGAIHAAAGDNIADGKFKSNAELRARFSTLGADGSRKIGVYCGSGNAAAHAIAAMSAAGLEAALYVGSWSAWSADPSRPVATGPEPG
jgi:thiosulfate/3-mercaptopyruvate sulfurtransferase